MADKFFLRDFFAFCEGEFWKIPDHAATWEYVRM